MDVCKECGKEKKTLVCYWFTECCGVLPAFGALTGVALVEREFADRVYVIAGDEESKHEITSIPEYGLGGLRGVGAGAGVGFVFLAVSDLERLG